MTRRWLQVRIYLMSKGLNCYTCSHISVSCFAFIPHARLCDSMTQTAVTPPLKCNTVVWRVYQLQSWLSMFWTRPHKYIFYFDTFTNFLILCTLNPSNSFTRRLSSSYTLTKLLRKGRVIRIRWTGKQANQGLIATGVTIKKLSAGSTLWWRADTEEIRWSSNHLRIIM